MSDLKIHQFPCRQDNYGVLIHDEAAGLTAAIDAPDAAAVKAALAERGWKLTHLLITHHHFDHTAGNEELKTDTGCAVIGPKNEADKVPAIEERVGEGDTFMFGNFEVKVFDTPGHTLGHISYWIPKAQVAFVGDTLFAMGCGRISEGTPEMMWESLEKLMALPIDTTVYCGHEYTVANGKFALTIEPDNETLKMRVAQVEALRKMGEATLPTTIDKELATNPFLRPRVASVRDRLGMADAEDWEVFAEIRERKNRA